MPSKYAAFISYSHADEGVAKWLMRKLESYTTPPKLVGQEGEFGKIPKKIGHIFRDRDELPSAGSLGKTVQKALENSNSLIVLCSPKAAKSEWVNKEIETFRRLGRADNIYCFIVSGTPESRDPRDACFPPALLAPLPGSTKEVEPLAADSRIQGDGKERAVIRLIAGMLGVGYDQLAQREAQRRFKRISRIALASLAGMAFTTFLAANAILAQNDAERRQEQAEDIVGFMLGDLREKLETVGRLDLMESVDTKATEYFASLDPRDLSDRALEEQARSLTKIGEVKLDLGDYDQAMEAFKEAHVRTSAIYSRSNENTARLFDLSQAEYWLGYVAWQQGRLDDAELWLTNYRDSTILLAKSEPDNFDYQLESAYGYQNLAVLDKTRGNYERAESAMKEVKTLYAKWLKSDPNNVELRYELANASSWLGSLVMAQGQYELAESYFDEQLSLIELNRQDEPNNIEWQEIQLDALKHSSAAKFDIGKVDESQAIILKAYNLSKQLHDRDPENIFWTVDLGDTLWKTFVYNGKQDLSVLEQAITLLEQSFEKNPLNTRMRHFLAYMHLEKANYYFSQNNLSLASDSLDITEQLLLEIDLSRIGDDALITKSGLLILRGQILDLTEKTQLAIELWERALSLFNIESIESVPFLYLPNIYRILVLLNKNQEAVEVKERLDKAGYTFN